MNQREGRSDYYPIVFEIECDWEKLEHLRVKRFDAPSNSWGHFVIANRTRLSFVRKQAIHNCDQRFDCVIGPTADGRSGAIDQLVDLVESGKLPLYKLNCKSIFPCKSQQWGLQCSFHTAAAVACLSIGKLRRYK